MEGNAARWKWQRGPTLGSLATTRLCRLRCRYNTILCRLILDAAAAQSYTYLGHVCWGSKLFLATAFLMLGDYNVVLGMTLERHISRIGQKAAVHEHGIT